MSKWRDLFRKSPVMTSAAAGFALLAIINSARGRTVESGICSIMSLQCGIAADAKRS